MHNIKRVAYKLLRTYSTKFPFKTSNAQEKKNLRKMKISKSNSDEFEDDLSPFEFDFMNIGKSYDTHQREIQKTKENIKRHIVRNKYFKEVQPSFLTFIEKDQIQRLHKSDPQEWTPEKLSKSFPALPDTIKKILKSKWVPKSVETAVRYDNKVAENWKNFQSGKLIVNFDLNEHLMKFKDRKINLVDRELLMKTIIPPKIVFPKPKSSMFSNIANEITSKEQSLHNQSLISYTSNINNSEEELITTDKESINISVTQTNKSPKAIYDNRTNNDTQKRLIFTEFMKMKLQRLYETSPEEGITLLKSYRKYIESINSENISFNELSDSTKQANIEEKVDTAVETLPKESTLIVNKIETLSKTITAENTICNSLETSCRSFNELSDITKQANIEEKVDTAVETLPKESTLIVKKTETLSKTITAENTTCSSLSTYVKKWNTSIDTTFKYTERIKIPKNVFKEGMTYRINDCYYDDDGEFLYRIPGVRN
ncbi:uncharacterized protein LOC143146580 [Ptiloglossa arizonensis]|uniref:uncharacterized protein LOC143146580 n=1 Tax=Ptiloglossa arizonensis TaxID=3350558 RepID=UPI003FA0233D